MKDDLIGPIVIGGALLWMCLEFPPVIIFLLLIFGIVLMIIND